MSSFFEYSRLHEERFASLNPPIPYKKGETLARGRNCWAYFLKEGLICVSFKLQDGTSRFIGYYLPGMTFIQRQSPFEGEDGELTYVATKPSTLYRMPRSHFIHLLRRDSPFAYEYASMLHRNQAYLVERITYQGEHGIEKRLLRWLVFMAKYYGDQDGGGYDIAVPLTQEVIASFMHTTRESVNKVLNKFIEEEHIEMKKKHLRIPDMERIKALIKE